MATARNGRELRVGLGRIYSTPGALAALADSGQAASEFLDRHIHGDWGDLSLHDRQANEAALQNGSRIFSAYHTSRGQKIWVITEAIGDDGKRASTWMMLPDEY